MDDDVTDQLIQNLINTRMFLISLDASTDRTSPARLAVFEKFPSVNIMKEELAD